MAHRDDIRRMAQDVARAELAERQAAERAAQGLELYPLATWHAFAPDQLEDLLTGVSRIDCTQAADKVHQLNSFRTTYEFGTERRDLSGALIGGATWRIERVGVSDWRLHLLQSEPCGVA